MKKRKPCDDLASYPVLEFFSLKSDWGIQKVEFMLDMIARYPSVDITRALVRYYAELDAFSQGKLRTAPLKSSARNMGKNDIWRSAVAVAATALYLDMELHINDNDFDHLPALELRLVKH
ncbi:hypothetical protein GCM10028816_34010 [Spirosoma lituiforme]